MLSFFFGEEEVRTLYPRLLDPFTHPFYLLQCDTFGKRGEIIALCPKLNEGAKALLETTVSPNNCFSFSAL